MIYRRRPSPLHAARAVVGVVWCLAIVTVALLVAHPLALGALVLAVALAGAAALVPRPVLIALALSVPFGVLVVVVNAIATRRGLTVIWRFGGPWDVTLEAVVQGGVHALSFMAFFGVAALYSAAVNPDDLLRACRRVSFASALTAALATRMVPVLWRDGQRLADAQRCVSSSPPTAASRLALVRAVSTNALDRALDVAATLEVRGYGTGGRAPALRRPWSRHDVAFLLSAVALVVLAIVARNVAPFSAYPRVDAPVDGSVALVSGLIVAAVLAPFAARRGLG
jgi:energy-coupling factor transport system permease protein